MDAPLRFAPGRALDADSVLLIGGCRADELTFGVPATGACCFTLPSNHNGNRRAPVAFVAGGVARLAVRRGTWADLLARDID